MSAPAIEIERCCRRCEEITREQAANFYYGIRLLPRDKRAAMCAVYAFARRVDDIGDDGSLGAEQQLAALAAERAMLLGFGDPRSGPTPVEDPVRIALEWACGRYALPLDALEFLVEGVEFDVRGERYETFGDLVAYCRRVAGAVGRLCVAIFTDGNVTDEVDALADDLGIAMQLTNIIRDVREDRDMGRVYLPSEDLERFGCALHAGVPALGGEPCAQLIRFQAARAAEWFDRGLQLTDHLDGRSAACVRAMTGIYREILDRIVADPEQVLRTRVSLAPWEKAWVAARSLATSTGVLARSRTTHAADFQTRPLDDTGAARSGEAGCRAGGKPVPEWRRPA